MPSNDTEELKELLEKSKETQSVKTPCVVKLHGREATGILRKKGFKVNLRSEEEGGRGEFVVSQSPICDAPITPGETVHITIGVGDTIFRPTGGFGRFLLDHHIGIISVLTAAVAALTVAVLN